MHISNTLKSNINSDHINTKTQQRLFVIQSETLKPPTAAQTLILEKKLLSIVNRSSKTHRLPTPIVLMVALEGRLNIHPVITGIMGHCSHVYYDAHHWIRSPAFQTTWTAKDSDIDRLSFCKQKMSFEVALLPLMSFIYQWNTTLRW